MVKKWNLPIDTIKRTKAVLGLITGKEIKFTLLGEVKAQAKTFCTLGELNGGKTRAASLTAKKRSESAKKAMATR